MALENRAVQTDRQHEKKRELYKWMFEHASNMITSLILPLMLGILTVVIANNQHKEVIRQQERDVKLRELETERESNRNKLQCRISCVRVHPCATDTKKMSFRWQLLRLSDWR